VKGADTNLQESHQDQILLFYLESNFDTFSSIFLSNSSKAEILLLSTSITPKTSLPDFIGTTISDFTSSLQVK